MGCGQSKMEEEYAVRHCRERSELLALAIRQRYMLADAHHAYAESLRSVGALLHDFLRGVQSLPPPPPEPALLLPQQRKGDGLPAASPPPAIASSSSAAPPVAKQVRIAPDDGHIRFSDDDSDSEGGHIKFHDDEEADQARRRPEGVRSAGEPGPPPPQMGPPYASGYAPPPYGPGYGYGYANGPGPGPGPGPDYGGISMNGGGGYEPGYGVMGGGGYGQSYGGAGYDDQGYGGMGNGGAAGGYDQSYGGIGGYGQSFFNINYARSQPPPPSVSHEHRLQATNARVHYYSGNGEQQPPPRGYVGGYYPPQSSSSYKQYAYGGYYGGGSAPAPPADIPSSSREPAAPPPPPSPPRVSTWDFLNPFETFESYYEQPTATAAPYSPSRSSKDVREEEGIPDLEDEDMEVVKEAYGDEKHPVKGYMGNGKAAKEEGRSSTGDELPRKSKASEASSSGSSLEHDVHVVEKSVVGEQVQPRQHVAGLPPTGSEKIYIDDTEVVVEIRTQFDRASQSASEVSKMLEVGKMPYYQKSSGFKVSAMMVCGIPTMEEFLRFEEDKAMGSGNLSSTLQKLYMWEKKLLEEVKAEERMRVLYDRKREELKMLDEKGAEAHKLEATELYIRKLSTKISIAIQIVNTISEKISKLRDEELWPQTCELIQGLMKMWSVMLECHQIQLYAISQAKNIDSMIDAAKFGDTHMDLIKQLELQLLDWIACFVAWVSAQKNYVKTLNQWLRNGVIYVPEETEDGAPPFSPGRLGGPPIFIICNNWAASVDMISEKEVVEAMQAFASNILNLWERHRSEQRQGLMANKGMDRDLRLMERDEQSMRKALEEQNKKLVLISNQGSVSLSAQVVHERGPSAEVGSLQTSLRNIFEAMENFTSASANTYKELHLRAEEEKARVAQESGSVS